MLLEREEQLTNLRQALADAGRGSGSLVLIAGEAGSGKTALVRVFVANLGESVLAIEGACDPLTTPRPLSPLFDFAADPEAGLSDLMDGDREPIVVFHDLLERLRKTIRPVVMVIEDVHWADAVTLDLLRFLGRRVGDTKALVVCTYRDDEVGPDHPLRPVLGQLIPLETTARLPVPPLSLQAIETLAHDKGVDAEDLHRLTDGNAFFVTEVLAGGKGLPDTVQDAVLSRVARLEPGARRVVEGVSIAPRSLPVSDAVALVGGRHGDVDESLSAGVLLGDGRTLRFRHELARSAVEESIPPARRLSLHRRMLALLHEEASPDVSRMAHHAIAAHDSELIAMHAPPAARAAAQKGAHKEAVSFLEAAIEHGAGSLDPDDVMDMRVGLSFQLGIVDRQEEARDQAQLAVDFFRETENRAALAMALDRRAAAQWRLHDRPGTRKTVDEAIELLTPLGPSRDLAYLLYHSAHFHMLARHGEQAAEINERATSVATEVGADDVLWMAEMMSGTIKIVCGEAIEGLEIIRQTVAKAEKNGDLLGKGVALSMLGSGGGEVRLYESALEALEEGIEHELTTDQDYSAAYSRAWQARIAFEQGRCDDAVERAELVFRTSPSRAGIAMTTATGALGRVRVRRGDPRAKELLEELLEGQEAHEIQHVWSPICGLAEHHWLAGNHDEMVGVLSRGYQRAMDTDSEWARGELGFWMWMAGAIDGPPDNSAEPFRLQVSGDWQGAADLWRQIGCPYEVGLALLDGDAEAQLKALEIFDDLGARPITDLARSRLRDEGVESIPRGPMRATRAHPAGLTNRQAEVLELMAEGMSNAEIADTLYIAKKTVEHHVSAIFSKLGVDSRTKAVVAARPNRD